MESTCCIAAVSPASECDVQGECLRLQQICLDALRYEALAWPKPGLVTPVDSGSHRDMNIGTLLASIDALRGSFAQLAAAGASARPFSVLQQIGIAAEREMLSATSGINTHRGAIFNLGLLVAAAARRQQDAALHGLHCGEVVARVWGGGNRRVARQLAGFARQQGV
jgi:triphosphoribosyl-dephospho-CoA synthase